mgnify:CR=1 FL=1
MEEWHLHFKMILNGKKKKTVKVHIFSFTIEKLIQKFKLFFDKNNLQENNKFFNNSKFKRKSRKLKMKQVILSYRNLQNLKNKLDLHFKTHKRKDKNRNSGKKKLWRKFKWSNKKKVKITSLLNLRKPLKKEKPMTKFI